MSEHGYYPPPQTGWQGPAGSWQPQEWPQGPPPRPPAMERAVRLMWVGAALQAVGTVANLLLTDPADPGPGFGRPNDGLDDSTLTAISYTSALIGGAVVCGLWLWMAWANGRGRNWARIVATVFGCIAAVTSVGSLAVLLVVRPEL